MIAAYLTAERGLGRIAIETDVDTLAVILVGSSHLLAAGSQSTPLDADDLREVVSTALEEGAHATRPSRRSQRFSR
jgi:hypothetical protein